jgi:hypothetical protein
MARLRTSFANVVAACVVALQALARRHKIHGRFAVLKPPRYYRISAKCDARHKISRNSVCALEAREVLSADALRLQ